jgi:hypothetical protein
MSTLKALKQLMISYEQMKENYYREAAVNQENYNLYIFHRRRYTIMKKENIKLKQRLKEYQSGVIDVNANVQQDRID